MNGAFGGGAHGVEAEQCAGRHDDAGSVLLGAFDQVAVVEELSNRERHEDAALVDSGDGDIAEQSRRQAFDDDVAVVGKRRRGTQGNEIADLRQFAARFVGVPHGDSSQHEARHVAIDKAPRHVETNRAKTGDTDTQIFLLRHSRTPVQRHSSRRQPSSVKLIFSPAASIRSLGPLVMPQWSSRPGGHFQSSGLPVR